MNTSKQRSVRGHIRAASPRDSSTSKEDCWDCGAPYPYRDCPPDCRRVSTYNEHGEEYYRGLLHR